MTEIDGKLAVVTGAASGIGRGTALALAKRGARLAITDLDRAGLAETAARIEALGAKATTYLVDVADRDAVHAFAQEIEASAWRRRHRDQQCGRRADRAGRRTWL